MFFDETEKEEALHEIRKRKILQCENEILAIIQSDDYIDGEVSKSELYMEEAFENNQLDYVQEALMQIYYSNIQNAHILEGVLIMFSCMPYDAVEPKGQIVAMGLVSNKELIVKDRAIQCFERWNSKRGLDVLRSLDCHPNWLQKYVDKVIMYIERCGKE